MAAGRYFLMRWKPNGKRHARLGVIVGRRAIPRAVDRNRCKRLVREVFRGMLWAFPALDVVVLCREAVPRALGGAAREELTGLFRAVGNGGNPRIAELEQ